MQANAFYNHGGLQWFESFWQLNRWNRNFFEAVGFVTGDAYKVYMLVMVMTYASIVFTQCI
jgi:hypothetical protein